MPFTLRLAVAFVIAAALAVAIAPFAALAVGAAGFRFPFPRIFDRTVMVTVALMLWWWARELRLGALLGRGFARPLGHVGQVLRGIAVAAVVIAILLGLGAAFGARTAPDAAAELARTPKYVAGAIAIAIIEEGFFRAVLLGGMCDDFGRAGALVVSSAIYALAHLVRAPGHFYLERLDAAAGVHNLAASFAHLLHPAAAFPALAGLFLLGLVLGEAFLLTGTVYLSMGLHAGLVIGAKLWPYSGAPAVAPPHWIIGYGHPALISGAAAWVMALAILALLPRLAGKRS
ncbi:MAG TPA: CPBP family glutamic-type intramembrane protease [Candidatus Binataceae bacterium]|jgi:membrane protease YdiL (CAAX protease family)|nr:CPBP family glutamic-type intramembrane protease [Candidatus Binataceae bacterium]